MIHLKNFWVVTFLINVTSSSLAIHKSKQDLTDLRQGRNSKLMDFEELNTDSAPALPLKFNDELSSDLLENDALLNQVLLNEVMSELSNDQEDRGGKDHEDKIGLEHTWNLDQDFKILTTGNIPKTKSSIIRLKQDSSDDLTYPSNQNIQGSPRSGLLNNFGTAMGSALSSQDENENFQTFPQLSSNIDEQISAANVRQNEQEKQDDEQEKAEEEEEEIRCIDKVMQVEETVYEEKIKCHHTFTEKCHETFITDYIPTQERKCETSFKKNCHITYKPMMFEETIKICNEPLQKICSNDTVGEEICKTHYETNCETRYKEHEVEQDEPVCEMVEEKRCKDVRVAIPGENALGFLRRFRRQGVDVPALQDSGNTVGPGQNLAQELQNDLQQITDIDKDLLSIGEECELWPVQKCRLEKNIVKKVHPETSCRKMPREICAPSNCAFVKAEKVCREEVRNLIQNIPSEDCNLQPQENCKMETVLVPRLIQQPNCIKIPKEICVNAKTNPRKVKKPIVKQWCYKPSDLKAPNTRLALSQFFNN